MSELQTQILVIGSGAGGAITAATLAEAGFQVLMVEEGPRVDTHKIETHTPQAIQQLYRNAGVTPMLGNSTIAFVEGCCVGGSTEVNSALWHRTPAEVLQRWRSGFNVEGLSEKEVNAYFEEIEQELNVSYLNSHALPKSSELFKRGADKLNWRIDEMPRAQNAAHGLTESQFYPGVRRSMSQSYIPRALAAGAQLLSDCKVIRLGLKKNRAVRVEALLKNGDGPTPVCIEAEYVFISAGATQTPAILRRSGIKKNVGNSLQIHPMVKVAALFPEQLDAHRSAIPLFQVKEFWPEITLGGAVFTPGFLAMTLAEHWNENQTVMQRWRHMGLYYATTRANQRGTVRVLPLGGEAIVRYRLSRRDAIQLNLGLLHLCRLLFAAGALRLFPAVRRPVSLQSVKDSRVFEENPLAAPELSVSAVHAFSSCPMGERSNVCAVDSFGKLRGYENIYLSDASILPDAPGVNPQGSIMAIALRNARHFIQNKR